MNTTEKKFRLRLLFQEIDLAPGAFVIGRAASCNLTIKDPLASREHTRLMVRDDGVELYDLESRNGTEINGKLARKGQLLVHGDRIKIGSYEFVFVVDLPQGSGIPTASITSVPCPSCGSRCPEGLDECPSCRAPIIASSDSMPPEEDATVPVELTDSTVKHNTQMLEEVINMALAVQHYDKAAIFVDSEISQFERSVQKGRPDLELLERISRHNLTVARGLEDGSRISWVVNNWADQPSGLPLELLDAVEQSAAGWHNLEPDWNRYLASVEISAANEPSRLAVRERLRALSRS